MQIDSRTDIAAPAEFVFARLTDFPHWEAMLQKRGGAVTRRAAGGSVAAWDIAFGFRGKTRQMVLELVEQKAPSHLLFTGEGEAIVGKLRLDLTPISASRCRLEMTVDLSARTLGARLLLQSMRLAKGALQGKVNARLGDMGQVIEDRYKAGSAA